MRAHKHVQAQHIVGFGLRDHLQKMGFVMLQESSFEVESGS